MFNKFISMAVISALMVIAVEARADWGRGDKSWGRGDGNRGQSEHGKWHRGHHKWKWDQSKWESRGGERGPYSKAWQVITHPTEAFAAGDITKNANGTYQLALESSDHKVDIVFPATPIQRDYGEDLVRYEALSIKPGEPGATAAYSLIFIRDREAVGLSADPNTAIEELSDRFETLKDKFNVEMKTVPGVHSPMSEHEHDYYFAYELTQLVQKQDNKRVPVLQIAERVIMIGPSMVIATIAGSDIEQAAQQFLKDVTVQDLREANDSNSLDLVPYNN
jgi:hypothetical protein